MESHTTTATFTPGLDEEALTAIVARSVLEAALVEDDTARLWFELESEEGESRRLDVELTPGDLEEILALAGSDDVALSLDGDYVAGLFDDAEVEAHGLRGAIAIAVTGAALLVPATAQAGLPQAVGAAATTQQATTQQATSQVTGQRAGAAATAQVSSLAAKTQVTLQRKAQVSKAQAAKVSGFKLLRGGLVR